jgi:putative ABC transport system ATP-binding protein
MSELLALSRVSKSYRRGPEEIHALRDVTLVLRPGELVGLVGPSGSGKSTLLMVAAGWERPDEGAVSWHGEGGAPGGAPWSAIALVPQRLGLVDELTVAENVAMPLRLAGGASSEIDLRTDELLAPLDLAPLARGRRGRAGRPHDGADGTLG